MKINPCEDNDTLFIHVRALTTCVFTFTLNIENKNITYIYDLEIFTMCKIMLFQLLHVI